MKEKIRVLLQYTVLPTILKKKKGKWLLFGGLVLSLLSIFALLAIVITQRGVEEIRDTTNYKQEVGAYYVSNEIHLLFSIDSLGEWDNAVRNSIMDKATKNTVYGTSFESYRFPVIKQLLITDLLYTLGTNDVTKYYAKVDTDNGSYRIMITLNNNNITEFKIF